ncbi:CbiX/SirB N-terminal domain-containing protein [Pseudophaeobacter sp.]|uniref:CbiX/SirB N-terminal domain-containing protein n=1 Tax=Pseudophaeobacter sp. TaxID=1971739 RepID=UPI00329A532D
MTASPPKIAILTAHGQPSAPEPPERALAHLAAKIGAFLPDWELRSATLAQEGRLEQVMVDGALVYPFFMAKGWFTTTVLPKRLAQFSYQMVTPFGLDPQLPSLAARDLRDRISANSARSLPTPPRILLAAHGSARGPKAAEATQDFAARLQSALPEVSVHVGYVEQAPFISTVAKDLPENSFCLPFFAQEGDHVRDDIPNALATVGFRGETLPVLGAGIHVPKLVAHALQMALEQPQ